MSYNQKGTILQYFICKNNGISQKMLVFLRAQQGFMDSSFFLLKK